MRLRVFLVVVIHMGLLANGGFSPADAGDASRQVKVVIDKAIDIQIRPDLKGDAHYRERARLMRQLIGEHFLARDIADQALGSYSKKVSRAQRSEFRKLFIMLFIDSYARMSLNFLQKEDVQYGPETLDQRGIRVPTLILRPNEHIPVVYALVRKKGGWYIRDVEIDGVSMVDNYRNNVRRAIARGSFNALLRQMRLQCQAIY